MRRLLAPLALFVLVAGLPAHVQLRNPSNGNGLHWNTPASISIVVGSTGSDDILDGRHMPAIQNAIEAWNALEGSTAHLVENLNAGQQARTDWASDSIHLVCFDEDDDSGYFPMGSGTVAITPVWFSNSGVITDADVLFNGNGFQFTTSGVPGRFDVQDIATHEIGHLLGLNHSGWAGASMYPYVDTSVILHRSPSEDEAQGLRECYPQAGGASIHGTLERANGSVVKGAQVVALDAEGRPAAATLSSNVGIWTIAHLAAGEYSFYAAPLGEPVSVQNLGAGYTVQTDFSATPLGSFTLEEGDERNAGTDELAPAAGIQLGRVMDDFPKRVLRGAVTTLTLHGSGLNVGSTLACSDPDVVVDVLSWNGTSVVLTVDVPAGEADGHLDLTATSLLGERHTLVAGLEITPPDPELDSVQPAFATSAGGTVLTIQGSFFRAGQRVVIGSNVYVDGAAGGCNVLDAETIQLRTRATDIGTYDVVVIDPSGVEGRRVSALVLADVPEVQSLFPSAGYAGGGTTIVLRGQNFDEGAVVRIDGTEQPAVVRNGATELVVTTGAGVPGGPYLLEVENPDGSSATSAFSYSVRPDPALLEISPPAGPSAGGQTIVIHGANFRASSSVSFGSDEATGEGGTPAKSVVLIDENTLEVVTPSHASGLHNVLVLDLNTGQAGVAPAAYAFEGSQGGGGGCYTLPATPPAGWREILAGAWWILAGLAFALLRARSVRPRERVSSRVWHRASSPSTSRSPASPGTRSTRSRAATW